MLCCDFIVRSTSLCFSICREKGIKRGGGDLFLLPLYCGFNGGKTVNVAALFNDWEIFKVCSIQHLSQLILVNCLVVLVFCKEIGTTSRKVFAPLLKYILITGVE